MKYFLKNLLKLVIICSLFLGCSFKPNNADYINLIRVSEDTLKVVLVDSYNRIKDISYNVKNDTLYIEILSIGHVKCSDEILIPLESSINIVNLQNDTIFNLDSIPKMY